MPAVDRDAQPRKVAPDTRDGVADVALRGIFEGGDLAHITADGPLPVAFGVAELLDLFLEVVG